MYEQNDFYLSMKYKSEKKNLSEKMSRKLLGAVVESGPDNLCQVESVKRELKVHYIVLGKTFYSLSHFSHIKELTTT